MTPEENVEFRIESAASMVAMTLMAALDQDLLRRYPDLPLDGIDPTGFEAEGGIFLVGYAGGEPVACGALRHYRDPNWQDSHGRDADEIKRMFVLPAFRRRGIARCMLARLESEAIRRGRRRLVLETGDNHVEAIALYRASGWRQIAPFGPYAGNSYSVCFEKDLK